MTRITLKSTTVCIKRVMLHNFILSSAALLLIAPLTDAHAQASLLLTLDDPTPQARAFFGDKVAAVGDINGDSKPDVAVVAAFQDAGQGQVFVFSGADGSPLLTLSAPSQQEVPVDHLFGHSVANIGDVSPIPDGVPDIAVGARRWDYDDRDIDQGAVFVFDGTDGSLLYTIDYPEGVSQWFGDSLAVFGPYLAVGAGVQDVGANRNEGRVFVFSRESPPLYRFSIDHPVPQADARFSTGSLAAVGDMNGDSVPELVVGAPFQDVETNTDQGQAYIFSGTDTLLAQLDDPTPEPEAWFGSRVTGVGDIDRDGIPDVAVSALGQNRGGLLSGQVFVLSGVDGSGMSSRLLWTLSHPDPDVSLFGNSLAGVGDVNGDTVPDIAVGSRLSGQGQVFVFSGADGMVLLTIDNPNPQAGSQFGRSIAAVGDLNNDSVSELAIGAHLQDVGDNADQGRVFVFSVSTGPRTVAIDIKPGSDPNCFNVDGHGVIPVAILGEAGLNVSDVDTESLFFAGYEVRVRGNGGQQCATEEVNGDGFPDLVCQFVDDDPDSWAPGDGDAVLTGHLTDGTAFEGSDSICVVP